MAPRTDSIRRIALFYRIFFLYFEPFMALVGTYLCIYDPNRFISGTVPAPALALDPFSNSPITQLLLTNIGALYALIAIIEGGILRLTREKKVWFAVLAAILASDVGHIYSVYAIAPERMTELASWSFDEWFSYGTFIGGAVLRVLFLLGIGRD